MQVPKDLLYTRSHEWVRIEGDSAKIGLTDHAQETLGDLVFVSLPSVGAAVGAGDVIADVESVKAVSDVYCPVAGTVASVNEALADEPERINADPYGAWICELCSLGDKTELLDAAAYETFVAEEA